MQERNDLGDGTLSSDAAATSWPANEERATVGVARGTSEVSDA
jgi:hypothetical protein